MGEPLADRPLDTPHLDRFPLSAAGRDAAVAVHARALGRGDSGYVDPMSGLFVMTASYLAERGFCCERTCRHCPYVQ